MLQRTKKWLLEKTVRSRGQEAGEFRISKRYGWHDERQSNLLYNAGIMYCLSEAGLKNMHPQVEYLLKKQGKADDSYILALIANTCYNMNYKKESEDLCNRLITLQNKETGEFRIGGESLCYAWGKEFANEISALSILALCHHPKRFEWNVRMAYRFLMGNKCRDCWGEGQPTMLALKAIVEYQSSRGNGEGKALFNVKYNGQLIEQIEDAGDMDILHVKYFPSQHEFMPMSRNKILVELVSLGENLIPHTEDIQATPDPKKEMSKIGMEWPVSINVKYYSPEPVSAVNCTLSFQINNLLPMYTVEDIAKLNINIKNEAASTTGMIVAIIRIPAAFEIIHEHLESLADSKIITFYEIEAGNNIYLYWPAFKSKQELHFTLFCNVKFGGVFKAKPSSVYEYYNKGNNIAWLNVGMVIVKEKTKDEEIMKIA